MAKKREWKKRDLLESKYKSLPKARRGVTSSLQAGVEEDEEEAVN